MKSFVVEYCKNWDGGKQEFNTAKSAVLSVHPDAKIIERRVDNYPTVVKIYVVDGESDEPIFTSDQRNLFSKNAGKRKDSIAAIMKEVAKY